MTVYEFNALDQQEKAEAVWRGTFLAERIAAGLHVQLYSLPGCYVEVFYDQAANQITGFEAFTNKQLLAPYLAQTNFPR
ncbi:hypothetical protein KHS38_13990 [Mucilaginibacter sp. Bleaf8]|uniref:hypothetical protein n=1 Tax=Mucilaginibacter sp. Bleaf8 TaxID=2834430 RepID=UPI001BCB2BFB|nr:hypothetical protein [Mucilaginibacter sp. Bleaf8]MBS7565519.1 hypothetical protein [Mucilaginibacter sp. Bleaf8]